MNTDIDLFIKDIGDTLDFCLHNGNFDKHHQEHIYSAIHNCHIALDVFKMSKNKIFSDIVLERQRQDEKFGSNRNQHPLEWNAILGEEVGEVNTECLEYTFYEKSTDDLRTELIQVAAVAVAWIENLDRNSTK